MAGAHLAKLIIGGIGDLAVAILVAAPMESWLHAILGLVFRQIKQAQDVGQRTVLPYVSIWMNASSLAFYGYNRTDWPVAVVNGLTFLMETGYCAFYMYYAHGGRRRLAVGMAVVQGAFLALLVSLQLTVFSHGRHAQTRDQVFGSFGFVTAIFMYLSTVDQTVRAYRTHDVADLMMAFPYLFNAVIWLVYAALPKFDAFVLLSSIVGVIATGYQAFLWVRYWDAPILQDNVAAGIAMSGGAVHPPVVPPANDPLGQGNAGIAMSGGAVHPPVVPPANDPLGQGNAGIAMSGGAVHPPVVPPANDPLGQGNAGIAMSGGAVHPPVVPPANDPLAPGNAGIAMSGGAVHPPVVPPANDPLGQGNAGIAMSGGAVHPPVVPPANDPLAPGNAGIAMSGGAVHPPVVPPANDPLAPGNAGIAEANGAAAAIDQAEGAVA